MLSITFGTLGGGAHKLHNDEMAFFLRQALRCLPYFSDTNQLYFFRISIICTINNLMAFQKKKKKRLSVWSCITVVLIA